MARIALAIPGKEDRPVTLLVDGDAKSVADAILMSEAKLVRLQRKDEPVWINPTNVLYVEDAGGSEPMVAAF